MILNYLLYACLFVSLKVMLYLIRKIRGGTKADIIRTSLFFVPFMVPAFFYGLPNLRLPMQESLVGWGIALGSSMLALGLQFKEFKPFLNKDFYLILPPMHLNVFLIIEISLIGSAVFEEIFYRFYLPTTSLVIDAVVSALLFCLGHFMQEYTRKLFDWKNYLILFGLSIAWYLSYRLTGTLLVAIAGHLLYNLPNMTVTFIRRYTTSRR